MSMHVCQDQGAARSRGHARRGVAIAILVGAGVLTGCDLSVTNPGPINDDALNEEGAHAAIVAGAGRALATALNETIRTSAALAREGTARSGNYGADPVVQQGGVDPNRNTEWDDGHRARFLAEDGVRRFKESLGAERFASYELGVRALLWAGYANRLLGENMCEAVIDGGAAQPHTVHFERAAAYFTEALDIARAIDESNLELAALAGRASVRAWQGQWTDAAADAALVPQDFAFQMEYHDISAEQRNLMWVANSNLPFRAWTVWNTPHEQYYLDSGDPRTAWEILPGAPALDAPIVGGARPPHYRQIKFADPDSPINLSSGHEMRLIEAEAALRRDAWQEAMTIINALRASVGVAPWEASSAEEAWTHLKRERGIELWLEGRRFGDLRRWIAEGAPGAFHPLEVDGGEVPFAADRDRCYPIPNSERATNPNL